MTALAAGAQHGYGIMADVARISQASYRSSRAGMPPPRCIGWSTCRRWRSSVPRRL